MIIAYLAVYRKNLSVRHGHSAHWELKYFIMNRSCTYRSLVIELQILALPLEVVNVQRREKGFDGNKLFLSRAWNEIEPSW